MRVGVVGVGTVGSAVADNLEQNHTVARWDPDRGYKDAIRGSEVVFICVYDIGDMELVDSVVMQYAALDAHIILKTTLMPGTTDALAARYKVKTIAYNPEFLSERTAQEDFRKQGYAVIGTHNMKTAGVLTELLAPFATRFLVMEPLQAEILKLAQNAFYALKVIYACDVAELCESHRVAYEPVRDALYMSPFIGPNHMDVDHRGYRGFGGACLPKDSEMFRRASGSRLIELALKLNGERC